MTKQQLINKINKHEGSIFEFKGSKHQDITHKYWNVECMIDKGNLVAQIESESNFKKLSSFSKSALESVLDSLENPVIKKMTGWGSGRFF